MPAKTPTPRRDLFCAFLFSTLQLVFALAAFAEAPAFRAGAFVVDISPVKFPVIVNAMFTERTADKVTIAVSNFPMNNRPIEGFLPACQPLTISHEDMKLPPLGE